MTFLILSAILRHAESLGRKGQHWGNRSSRNSTDTQTFPSGLRCNSDSFSAASNLSSIFCRLAILFDMQFLGAEWGPTLKNEVLGYYSVGVLSYFLVGGLCWGCSIKRLCPQALGQGNSYQILKI